MTITRITFACLLATVALVAAACGGGSDTVPTGAIAVVGGTDIAKKNLDELIAQAKKGYESQNQDFPKAGTPEYQSIQTQYVAYLVELEQLRQAAEELGVSVSEKDVDAAEKELIKTRFNGKRSEYEKALEQQGFTAAQYRENALEVSALSTKIFNVVTKDVKVTEQEILAYYTQNQSQYGTPESRDVRHILIAEKDADGKVDFQASKAKADEIYAQLAGGADFAELAKENSADPGSKDTGGKLTISRGQTVSAFYKVAFALKTNAISDPVKTEFGYHIIQAVGDVKPATTTPLKDVKSQIRQQLAQTEKNQTMTDWLEKLKSDYADKVAYAVGFNPPPAATTTTGTTTTEQ